MNNRYSRVFALEGNLYTVGSPVIIRTGALLKDSMTGNILAQLKFENLDNRIARALTVSLQPMDIAGNELDAPICHQYLDFVANRGSFFGQTEAVSIPSPAARKFSVAVTEVIFEDGSKWSGNITQWTSVPEPNPLSDQWEQGLIEQYRLDYCIDFQYSYQKIQDLWYCSCGGLNHSSEERCHKCGQMRTVQENLDLNKLRSDYNARLQLKKQEQEECARLENERRLKIKRKRIGAVILVLSLLLTAAALDLVISNLMACRYGSSGNYEKVAEVVYSPEITRIFNKKLSRFVDGCKIMNSGNYSGAQRVFSALPGYLDADHLANEAAYRNAGELLEDGMYESAKNIYKDLSAKKYLDSDRLMKECDYRKAEHLRDAENDPKAASEIFAELAEVRYRDSKEQAIDCYYAYCMDLKLGGRYVDAYYGLCKLENMMDVDEPISDVKEEIYQDGIESYRNKKYYDAKKSFTIVGNTYKNAEKYLTLIYWRTTSPFTVYNDDTALDRLLSLLNFEDTRELLQTGDFANCFLTGSWRAKNEWKYLELNEEGQISYNFPSIDYGEYYRIENGVFLSYNADSPDYTRKLFGFSIISKNEISIHCYKDGSRYHLFRQ